MQEWREKRDHSSSSLFKRFNIVVVFFLEILLNAQHPRHGPGENVKYTL